VDLLGCLRAAAGRCGVVEWRPRSYWPCSSGDCSGGGAGVRYAVCTSTASTLAAASWTLLEPPTVASGLARLSTRLTPQLYTVLYGRCAKSSTVPDRRIDVWANQTHKSASLTGLDSPLFGGTTIILSFRPYYVLCLMHRLAPARGAPRGRHPAAALGWTVCRPEIPPPNDPQRGGDRFRGSINAPLRRPVSC